MKAPYFFSRILRKYVCCSLLLIVASVSFAQLPLGHSTLTPTGGCHGLDSFEITGITRDGSYVFALVNGIAYNIDLYYVLAFDDCYGLLSIEMRKDGKTVKTLASISNYYIHNENSDEIQLNTFTVNPGVYDLIAFYNSLGESFGHQSASAKVSVIDVTGVTPLNETSGISIFPNPASDVLHVDNKGIAQPITDISITDVNGRRMKSIRPLSGGDISVNVGDLPSGMYFLRLLSAENMVNRKIMIRH